MARLGTMVRAALYHARQRRLARQAGSPVNTVAPAITGTAQVGQQLTCSNGTWTNTPLGYRRTWRRNGTVIAGATGNTYTLVQADQTKTLTCTVTALNASGCASATSAATSTIT